MNLKRYRVNNIKEALKFIKRDLGPDALIVSTRQVKDGKGAFGIFGKKMLEVTAAPSEKKKKGIDNNLSTSKVIESLRGETEVEENILTDTFLNSPQNNTFSVSDQTRKMILPIQKELQGIRVTLGDLTSHSHAFDDHLIGELKNELGEMRHILHVLASQSGNLSDPDMPENLLLLYQQMKFSGLEEKFARRLVIEAQRNMNIEDVYPHVEGTGLSEQEVAKLLNSRRRDKCSVM